MQTSVLITAAVAFVYETADYFPEIERDLTLITWEHSVNSQRKLAEALAGESLMIKAGIVLGYVKEELYKKSAEAFPVMAHSATTVSNFTLEEFLDTFSESDTRKGIKFDFKSSSAFAASEDLIEKFSHEKFGSFPIWLSADIVPGPINATAEVVDPDYFLSSWVSKFPYTTMSVGWTTKLKPGSLEGSYSKEDIDRMTDVLISNMITTPVTFAVRAAFAARSVERLIALINTSPTGSTLTVWQNSPGDVVDPKGLQKLIDGVGRDRVFLDIPIEMMENLNSTKKPPSSSSCVASLSVTALIAMFSVLMYIYK